MASRRETEQAKSKEAVEEVQIHHYIFGSFSIHLFGERCALRFEVCYNCLNWYLQVETREEQNKKWEETRAGRVDSWRNWTNGKRKGSVRGLCNSVTTYYIPNLCLSPFCDSGPTFIKPPKIQKEEDKRQVQ